ncbi:hypothetical protein RMATCC62417_17067 [Rhizopus microsporus]|nr:hypothetical protein RMATCC62417_17067 [Rhizopus microsporus]
MNENLKDNIELLSYAKLAEYDQTRIDLSIRKYVLITNLLREPKEDLLEQHWFDTCLNELTREEEQQQQQQQQQQNDKIQDKPNVQLYYNFNHRNGFLVYTSNL